MSDKSIIMAWMNALRLDIVKKTCAACRVDVGEVFTCSCVKDEFRDRQDQLIRAEDLAYSLVKIETSDLEVLDELTFFVPRSNCSELTFDPSSSSLSEPGAICGQCKRDYPYADNVVDFVCWGCREGY